MKYEVGKIYRTPGAGAVKIISVGQRGMLYPIQGEFLSSGDIAFWGEDGDWDIADAFGDSRDLLDEVQQPVAQNVVVAPPSNVVASGPKGLGTLQPRKGASIPSTTELPTPDAQEVARLAEYARACMEEELAKRLWESAAPHIGPPIQSAFVCECGAEKVGSGGHSPWCPKFEGMVG